MILCGCGSALVPVAAAAQAVGTGPSIVIEPVLDRKDVAGNRFEPSLAPKPVVIGPFFARPRISLVAGYDSNLLNQPRGQSAAVAYAMPSLEFASEGGRHEFTLAGAATLRRYASHRSENSDEYQLRASARSAISDRAGLIAEAQYARLIEPRSSSGTALNADEPAAYRRANVSLAAPVNTGRLRVIPQVAFQRVDYEPLETAGIGTDQSFRDTRRISADVRIEYRLSGLLSAFASGTYQDTNSVSVPAAQARDSHDVVALAGLRGEVTPVISGELAVGYRARDYANPAFRDFSGTTFRADLQWYVTPLVTLQAQIDREFRNSGSRLVAGILTDSVSLSAYYDPLRNLRLGLGAAFERGRYRETATRSQIARLQARAEYRLSRQISFGGYLIYRDQSVSGTPVVRSYSAFTAGLGVTVTP